MMPTEIILHIGPPKCASTSIQRAMQSRQREFEAYGIRVLIGYSEAIHELYGMNYLNGTVPNRSGAWRKLRRQIEQADTPRVIFSNELLGFAPPSVIETIARDLGTTRISAVFCVRPIARLLPSYWQERIKAGAHQPLPEWLEQVMTQREGSDLRDATNRFWRAERHDQLATRWARVLGKERVTAIILDESDPDETLRSFARAVEVAPEIFSGVKSVTNRSLSAWEATALQYMNAALILESRDASIARVVSSAASDRFLAREVSAGPRSELPQHIVDVITPIQTEIIAGLHSSGIRIIGDPSKLASPVVVKHIESSDPFNLDATAQIATDLALAALSVSGILSSNQTSAAKNPGRYRALLSPRILLVALIGGVLHRIGRRLRARLL